VAHILYVQESKVAAAEAALRSSPGFVSVSQTSRRYRTAVTTPYFPSDPYFQGFTSTVAPTSGATAPPPTFESEPLVESASVPGQWDMHVERLEYAFGYSQPGNGSGITNGAALGSTSTKIAIIDTGEDTTSPELASTITYQKCFITDPNGNHSTSNFTTDPQGHGTDVAGIAGAAIGNAVGFTAAAGHTSLLGYRVFPTPDDNCTNDTTNDQQCGADTYDIAAAIEDAVNTAHANVISLSLGGGGCTSGQDNDPTEGAAIADAIAANIVVVAAAGNEGTSSVDSPACDPGVIAVGATGLADGQANGTGSSTGSASAPNEYVASYSNYGSPGAAVNSAAAWGIVAPGGDPNGDDDADDLHWIENIWTSTPYMSSASDTSFEGECVGDYPAETGTVDCRTLIAGTSMSTPHVAGAAALIISAGGSAYQSPTAMKTLLCETADDIAAADEGCGRLDVYRAMAKVLGDADPGPRAVP
jgi:subtilisin family serine protease